MKNKKYSALHIIMTILPLIVTLLILPKLPDQIPTHYGFTGQADGWGSKYESLVLPIIIILIGLLIPFLSALDPKYEANAKSSRALNYGMLFIFNILTYLFLYSGLNNIENLYSIKFYQLLSSSLCILVVVIGNYLPKCKQNNIIGFRVSWTLENEQVWYMTHRFCGKVWMIGGIILLPICIFAPSYYSFGIILVGLAILTIIPLIYSYKIYKKLS